MHRYEVIICWSDEDRGLKSFLRPIVLLASQACGRSLEEAIRAMITGSPRFMVSKENWNL